MRELEKIRKHKEDIWSNIIKARISDEMQKTADNDHMSVESPKDKQVESLRDFFLSGSILSANDFFIEVCLQIKKLKTIIEDNRNNDKNAFYNPNKPKDENDCRDLVMIRLQDRCEDSFLLTKELHEADNRVDMSIKYIKNHNFEVQIECKKDNNSAIYTGIQYQLIDKYLSSAVQYGIYLIFYFGAKKNKKKILEKIKLNIPDHNKNNIEIICIDFRT